LTPQDQKDLDEINKMTTVTGAGTPSEKESPLEVDEAMKELTRRRRIRARAAGLDDRVTVPLGRAAGDTSGAGWGPEANIPHPDSGAAPPAGGQLGDPAVQQRFRDAMASTGGDNRAAVAALAEQLPQIQSPDELAALIKGGKLKPGDHVLTPEGIKRIK
jgi:hypothetical protein